MCMVKVLRIRTNCPSMMAGLIPASTVWVYGTEESTVKHKGLKMQGTYCPVLCRFTNRSTISRSRYRQCKTTQELYFISYTLPSVCENIGCVSETKIVVSSLTVWLWNLRLAVLWHPGFTIRHTPKSTCWTPVWVTCTDWAQGWSCCDCPVIYHWWTWYRCDVFVIHVCGWSPCCKVLFCTIPHILVPCSMFQLFWRYTFTCSCTQDLILAATCKLFCQNILV